MDDYDIARLGVVGLSAAFQEQRLTPLEVLHVYENRIQSYNSDINAFLDLRLDAARDEASASTLRWKAGAPRSKIDGVPYGVKANIAVKGLPWHGGIGAYRDRIADKNADIVERLSAGGAVALGVLNMHEGALGATTDNPFFGKCCNPWDLEKTPGGSSGGSGAAVGAGLCAFALGTDTMGSVRIPSAYCGVAGIKPTYGLAPSCGLVDLSPTLDHIGPHAFSARDLQCIMPVISEIPGNVKNEVKRIGIGKWGDAVKTDRDVSESFAQAVSVLENLFQCREIDLSSIEFGLLRRRGLLISEAEGHRAHAEALKTNPQGFSDEFRALLEWGARQEREKINSAYEDIRNAGNAFLQMMEEVDVLVLPTAPQGPFRFDAETPANQADFTALANMARCPAVAVPASCDGGPPASLQFIARPGEDSLALRAADMFENLRGPAPRPPGFS